MQTGPSRDWDRDRPRTGTGTEPGPGQGPSQDRDRDRDVDARRMYHRSMFLKPVIHHYDHHGAIDFLSGRWMKMKAHRLLFIVYYIMTVRSLL